MPPNTPFPEGMYVKDLSDLETLKRDPSSVNLRVLATVDLASRVLPPKDGVESTSYVALIKEDFARIGSDPSPTTAKTKAQGQRVLGARSGSPTPSIPRSPTLEDAKRATPRQLQQLKNDLPLISVHLQESKGMFLTACRTLDALTAKLDKLDKDYQNIKGLFAGLRKFWNRVSRNSVAKDATVLRSRIEERVGTTQNAMTAYKTASRQLAQDQNVKEQAEALFKTFVEQTAPFMPTLDTTLTSLINSLRAETLNPAAVSDKQEDRYKGLSQRRRGFEQQQRNLQQTLAMTQASSVPGSPTSSGSFRSPSPTSATGSDSSSDVFSLGANHPPPDDDDDHGALYA